MNSIHSAVIMRFVDSFIVNILRAIHQVKISVLKEGEGMFRTASISGVLQGKPKQIGSCFALQLLITKGYTDWPSLVSRRSVWDTPIHSVIHSFIVITCSKSIQTKKPVYTKTGNHDKDRMATFHL